MKYTLLVTRRCNLRCDYCYVGKDASVMSLETAGRIVDLAYARTPPGDSMDFVFFGGEPLLEFERVKEIVALIEEHPHHDSARVRLTLVSNGTLFHGDIARFLGEKGISFGISCDGPAAVQDRFRRYPGGRGSSRQVERNLRDVMAALGHVMVNAVYGPETLADLPGTIDYFSSLGVRQIFLSPDYSAPWGVSHCARLPQVYGEIASRYQEYYRIGDPHFISLIDSKIAVILRGGYQSGERCSMGRGELAFTPDGAIYPCERLVGNAEKKHCIGHIDTGIQVQVMLQHRAGKVAPELVPSPCDECTLKPLCMNWCGCSNYFGSGYYDRAPAFLCASERAAIGCAAQTCQILEQEFGELFFDHAGGAPLLNSVQRPA